MADRLAGLSDRELGAALAGVSRDVAFPEVPDLPAAVIRRLEEEPARAPLRERVARLRDIPSLRRPGRRVVLALAAVLVLAGGAVAGGLLVRGVRILIAPEGTPPPSPTSTGPAGRFLLLGEWSSLGEARHRVDFPVLVPTASGLPEPVVYVDDHPAGGRVSLVYPSGPELPQAREAGVGMLVMEFVGRPEVPFLEKLVEADQIVEVEVAGTPGYWIQGRHEVSYLDSRGRRFDERSRLAGNTLLWQQGDVTVRLESALPVAKAIRVAESMR